MFVFNETDSDLKAGPRHLLQDRDEAKTIGSRPRRGQDIWSKPRQDQGSWAKTKTRQGFFKKSLETRRDVQKNASRQSRDQDIKIKTTSLPARSTMNQYIRTFRFLGTSH